MNVDTRTTPPGVDGGRNRERVGIIRLVDVGVSLAISFLKAGLDVIGIDSNERRVFGLSAANSPIDDFPDRWLWAALERGLRIETPTRDTIATLDGVFVCVPTSVDRANDRDLAPITSAATTKST